MSPEQLAQFNDMKMRLEKLERAENVAFVESLNRRLINSFNIPRNLSDLNDVDIPSPTNGQVLKYTTVSGARWIAGADNI